VRSVRTGAACASPWACGKNGCSSNPKWSSGAHQHDGGAEIASPATISSAAIRCSGVIRRRVALLLRRGYALGPSPDLANRLPPSQCTVRWMLSLLPALQ
jgi:hypothetical protein